MATYFDGRRTPIIINEEQSKEGGQATVYLLPGQPDSVVKISKNTLGKDDIDKLSWMIKNPPDDPCKDGHVSFAWPRELVFNQAGRVVGYIMPYIQQSPPVLDIFNPTLRRNKKLAVNWQFLHVVASNIASDIASLHDRDYLIGDINEGNVLVSSTARVTLIDADSFQVRTNLKTYPCPVGKEEYSAREVVQHGFAKGRTKYSDSFGLAVLIYQLLLEGNHPYRGRWTAAGDPPSVAEKIQKGHFPHGKNRGPNEPLKAPRPIFEDLPPALRVMFLRAFVDGHQDPRLRPLPGEWQKALIAAQSSLRQCLRNPEHYYYDHATSCPWCSREAAALRSTPRPRSQPDPNQEQGQFRLRSARPSLRIRGGSLEFDFSNDPAPQTKKIRISNDGQGLLNVQVASNQKWCSVSPAAFTISANQSGFVDVTAACVSNLSSQQAVLSFTSNGGAGQVQVLGTFQTIQLKLSPASLDFGRMPRGEAASRVLQISNTGGSACGLTVQTYPAWLSASSSSLNLSPGVPSNLVVKIDPSRVAESKQAQNLHGTVTFTGPGNFQARVSVTATLETPALVVEQTRLAFGRVGRGELAVQFIRIGNQGAGDLVGSLAADPAWLSLSVSDFQIEPGGFVECQVVVDTNLVSSTMNSFFAPLTIRSNGGIETINIFGAILDAVLQVSAVALSAGSIQRANLACREFLIANPGEMDLVGRLELETPCDWIVLDPSEFRCPPATQQTISVYFETSGLECSPQPQPFHNRLLIYSNGGSSQVELDGKVLSPYLVLDRSEIRLGEQQHGSLSRESIIVQNTGSSPLRFDILSYVDWIRLQIDPNQELGLFRQHQLSPGASCTVQIVLDTSSLPHTPGVQTYKNVISINSNAGNTIVLVSLDLICPLLSLQEASLDFGRLLESSQTVETIHVSNQGLARLDGILTPQTDWLVLPKNTFSLAPGQDEEIAVGFNPDILRASKSRAVTGNILLQSNGGQADLHIKARLDTALLQAVISGLEQLPTAGDRPRWVIFNVTNPGWAPLSLDFPQQKPGVEVHPARILLMPGHTRTVEVRLGPESLQRLNGQSRFQLNIHAHGSQERWIFAMADQDQSVSILHRESLVPLSAGVSIQLIHIPSGDFWIGANPEIESANRSVRHLQPRRLVGLSAYWISQFLITNQQYEAFRAASKGHQNHPGPVLSPDHPVTNISWHDAQAFCAWATRTTGLFFSLPTEAEWEKAAAGPQGNPWPAGNQPPDAGTANFHGSGVTPVGHYSPQGDSPYGCADMAGNVAEWTQSRYFPARLDEGQVGIVRSRVLKGGSWFSPSAADLLCAARARERETARREFIGFRCVVRTGESAS